MQKPIWYEDEIARLMRLYRYDRAQAEEHIEREIVEYKDQFEEYEQFEEIAWEYYEYVRKYFIEKEAFAQWMVEENKTMLNPVTLFEARLYYECYHLNYFEDFESHLKDRKLRQK